MILLGVALLLLALLGAPLFAVIAVSALAGFTSVEIDQSVVLMEIYRIAETPVLLAIPLFTFAGWILGESDAPKRLVRLSDALLGWMPGGLAVIATHAPLALPAARTLTLSPEAATRAGEAADPFLAGQWT